MGFAYRLAHLAAPRSAVIAVLTAGFFLLV
jgi:hypothetical protein